MRDTRSAFRSALETVLNFSGNLPSEYHYRCPVDFVLREGQFFEPRPLSKEIEQGLVGVCFLNAFQTAISRDLPYVEGYACSTQHSLPLLHAWNLDAEGFVVDTTWEPVGAAYLGVIFPLSSVGSMRGQSIIDDWQNRWPLLREPWGAGDRERMLLK